MISIDFQKKFKLCWLGCSWTGRFIGTFSDAFDLSVCSRWRHGDVIIEIQLGIVIPKRQLTWHQHIWIVVQLKDRVQHIEKLKFKKLKLTEFSKNWKFRKILVRSTFVFKYFEIFYKERIKLTLTYGKISKPVSNGGYSRRSDKSSPVPKWSFLTTSLKIKLGNSFDFR